MKINIETHVSFNLYMVKCMYILNIRFKISLISINNRKKNINILDLFSS